MIEQRKMLTPFEKEVMDKHIVSQILNDQRYQEAETVGLFYPRATEIDLRALLSGNKTFLFPKVIDDDIVFYPYHPEMRFTKSAFGVYEPDEGTPYLKVIDYMLMPALAIDLNGHRIGYGKGFYDRYLKAHRPKTALGVIYSFQLIDHIDHSEFDQTLDGYVNGYYEYCFNCSCRIRQ